MDVPSAHACHGRDEEGLGFLAEKAAERTVVLTNHGKPTAVVMSPEHFDELERSLRHAADRLVQGVTDLVAERSEFLAWTRCASGCMRAGEHFPDDQAEAGAI